METLQQTAERIATQTQLVIQRTHEILDSMGAVADRERVETIIADLHDDPSTVSVGAVMGAVHRVRRMVHVA